MIGLGSNKNTSSSFLFSTICAFNLIFILQFHFKYNRYLVGAGASASSSRGRRNCSVHRQRWDSVKAEIFYVIFFLLIFLISFDINTSATFRFRIGWARSLVILFSDPLSCLVTPSVTFCLVGTSQMWSWRVKNTQPSFFFLQNPAKFEFICAKSNQLLLCGPNFESKPFQIFGR